jgi:hypothetical protein
VPGFEPAFKANISFGADWFTIDFDHKFGRVDVRAIAKYDCPVPNLETLPSQQYAANF